MRRSVRVQMNFVVDIDDDGQGIPWFDAGDTLERVTKAILPQAERIRPGGRVSMGLTRESMGELRKARKAAR
jgi:hypothetical protein